MVAHGWQELVRRALLVQSIVEKDVPAVKLGPQGRVVAGQPGVEICKRVSGRAARHLAQEGVKVEVAGGTTLGEGSGSVEDDTEQLAAQDMLKTSQECLAERPEFRREGRLHSPTRPPRRPA